MTDPLERLLQHPSLWRAGGRSAVARTVLPTGFETLDRQLPGGGWPFPALIEFLMDRCGLGEIGLLVPALRELQRRAGSERPGMLTWINPPYIPYAPGLAQRGLELQRQIVTGPLTAVETLWTMEQALRSGACAAVLAWADVASTQSLRRLKLAAFEGGSLGVLFRSPRQRIQASPANLRLSLNVTGEQLQIELVKVQGGAQQREVKLPRDLSEGS